jgi:hypothetical protein
MKHLTASHADICFDVLSSQLLIANHLNEANYAREAVRKEKLGRSIRLDSAAHISSVDVMAMAMRCPLSQQIPSRTGIIDKPSGVWNNRQTYFANSR